MQSEDCRGCAILGLLTRLSFGLLMTAVLKVEAAVVIKTDGVVDPDFRTKVNNAIAAWRATADCRDNPDFRRLLRVIDDPNSRWTITIRHTPTSPTNPMPSSETLCLPVMDSHDPRKGAPCDVYWNPDNDNFYSFETVRRDPTASLIHELAHAAQSVLGEAPRDRISMEDLGGVYIENMYRRSNPPLPMRTSYGLAPLDPNALLPCCGSPNVGCNNMCIPPDQPCPDLVASPCGARCPTGWTECHAGLIDGLNNRPIPPWCCPPGSVAHIFRPNANPMNPAQPVCCAQSDQLTAFGCESP
jgi:hypothetical protein